jgi:hypothetical protein
MDNYLSRKGLGLKNWNLGYFLAQKRNFKLGIAQLSLDNGHSSPHHLVRGEAKGIGSACPVQFSIDENPDRRGMVI